jgi:hypothetical protein
MKSIMMRWMKHRECMRELRHTYRNLIAKSEQKVLPLDLVVGRRVILKRMIKK